MVSDKFKDWSFAQLTVRWRHLCINCWNYNAPTDAYFHEMLEEVQDISAELELRGYAYSLENHTWYDAIRY